MRCGMRQTQVNLYQLIPKRPPSRGRAGMTLVEVLIALVLSGLAVGGIISGYTYCTTSAEKGALSLAANARSTAIMQLAESDDCAGGRLTITR